MQLCTSLASSLIKASFSLLSYSLTCIQNEVVLSQKPLSKMTVMTTTIAESKGRTLVAGATGFIGRFVAEASLDAGRPTFILVRPGPIAPSKAKVVNALEDRGGVIVQGLVNNKEWMEKILRDNEINVVISAVGGASILDQIPLVNAMKSVPSVKRFLASEFGHDVDRANPVEPGLEMYLEKRAVRRAIEEAGVPYTHICCNSIASWPYYDNTHPSEVSPPMDRFQIYGDGNVKAYFVAGPDIGKFTIKTVEDPRTLNKLVHFRPPCNYLSVNELASIWEKKIGKTLPRVTVTEEDLLSRAAEKIIPQSIVASFTHDIFIKGCQVDFDIEGPNDVEIGDLYPNETYKTVEECFDEFVTPSNKKERGHCEDEATTIGNNKKLTNNNNNNNNNNNKKDATMTTNTTKSNPVVEALAISIRV